MPLRRINYGRGHGYAIDGVKVDGVTTLIGDGLPKPALTRWAARSVAEYVADNLDAVLGMRQMGRDAIVAALKEAPWTAARTGAAKGTEVHGLAEKLIRGEEIEVPEHLAGYVDACVAFLDAWKVRPLLVERPVGNRQWRYGGTADFVGEVTAPDAGPVVAMVDWKTAASGVWPETAYQLAAYRFAEVYLDEDGAEKPMAGLGITTGYAVWLRSDGYDVLPVECGETTFKAFLHICWVARAAKTNRELIGEAVGA
jgi:hypothetical protein